MPGALRFVSENGGRRVHVEKDPPPSRYIIEVVRTRGPQQKGMIDVIRVSLDIEAVGPWHECAVREIPVTDPSRHLTEGEVSAIVEDMLSAARRDDLEAPA